MLHKTITIRTILLDMDGVLWRGSQSLLNIPQLLEGFENLGCRVYCVTNNSTRTISEYLEVLKGFGAALDADQVVTSAEATGAYLANRLPAGSKVYIVGERGLKQTVSRYGFELVKGSDHQGVKAVVVGLDRDFEYSDLNQAVHFVRRGADLIGTNPDRTIPTAGGPAPGAGALIAAIEASCGSKAHMIGKPSPGLYDLALSRSGSNPRETLMIGDRLDTDIKGAQDLSIHTGLVLSGVTSREAAEGWKPPPDIIAKDAWEILQILRANDGKLI